MKILLLLLAGAGLPDRVSEYLAAPPGSPEEGRAVEAIRLFWDADHAAVAEAIRRHLVFPPRAAGLHTVSFPLPRRREGDAGEPHEAAAALYLPEAYDPAKRWPALLVVHGTSGFADQELRTLAPFAERHGLVLLAPQDALRRGGGGWGYSDYEHAIHTGAVRWLKRNVNVDDSRLFVIGASRGGHAAWDLACAYPDLFAGAVPIVGAPKNRYFRFLPNLLHVPVLDLQGAKDQALLVEYLEDAIGLLEGWGYDVTYRKDPAAGHFYPVDWEEVWAWMKDRRRPRSPKRVIRVATRNDRARAYWLELEDLPEKRFAHPKPAVNATGRALTREEQKKLVRENYETYRARAEAVVQGNEVALTVSRCPRLTVRLNDELVDLGKKVTITVNGRVRLRRRFSPSLETLLGRVKETGDRDLLYPVAVQVRGAR